MQALRSLFSRTASKQPAATAASGSGKPVELSLAQQAQVAGGLPRVSAPPAAAVDTDPLPRVS